MNVFELVDIILKETGHVELAELDYNNKTITDKGIYRQINWGNKYLDVNFPINIYNKIITKNLPKDVYKIDTLPVKFIKNINVINENGTKIIVNPTTYPYVSQLNPQKGLPTLFYRVDDADDNNNYNIFLFPIPDKDYLIEIYGVVYDVNIENEQSETYWLKYYPELLIEATKMAIEHNLHRNYEAELIYKQMIDNTLSNIYYKLCQEELSGEISRYEKDGYPKEKYR